jgi:prephenate dehydratase
VRANGWKATVAGDTAGAAKLVSNSGDKTMAAFAPEAGRRICTGSISWPRMSRTPKPTSPASSSCRGQAKIPPRPVADERVVTTFVFRVRNIPAALYKAMGGFATNGVNMTKLESYQIGGKFFATQFYADIQGHPDEAPVARAMEELEFFSRELRILGVYPAHPFRLAQNGAVAEEQES